MMMQTKSRIIAAILSAALLTTGVFGLEGEKRSSGSGRSEYDGFSYEAHSILTAKENTPTVSVTESHSSITVPVSEYTGDLEADIFFEGGRGDELTGEEKLYNGLIAGDRLIEFDYDDFVYMSVPGNTNCEEFIDYYYTLIQGDPELSHVYYGFDELQRGRIGSDSYFIGSVKPKYDYGKSGIEKLVEGLENGDAEIAFDYNDFAYHTVNDGEACAKFRETIVTLATEHPEYRVRSFGLSYASLSKSVYAILRLNVEYDAPLPEDDGIPTEEKILEGLLERRNTIEFDSNDFVYAVPDGATGEELHRIIESDFGAKYFYLVDAHPELFYVDSRKAYSYSYIPLENNTIYISSFTPKYNDMSENEIRKAREFVEYKVSEIVEYIESYADTDFERALLLHDFICLNYEYDESLEYHDIYSFLSKEIGVCESYAKLYRYVLERLGMNVKYASSESMEHLWNVIEIDGKWYNVDVTWADPIVDKPGYVRHDYFLVSDEDFKSSELYDEEYGVDPESGEPAGYHHDYVTDDGITCNDRFEGDFWTARAISEGSDIQGAPIVFDDSSFYCITNTFDDASYENTSAVTAVSKANGKTRTVAAFDDMWESIDGEELYVGAYSGLALVNGVLVYNTPTEIRYVLPNGNHNICVSKIAYDDDKYDKHHKNNKGLIYRFGVSLDGKNYEHETFYTILNNKSKEDSGNNGKNDYFGVNNKYNKFDKNGKNKENIEIDYFIADTPSDRDVDERDFNVEICSDSIHSFRIAKNHKPTFLTKGWTEKVCEICDMTETDEVSPLVTEGENGHAPNANDVYSVFRAFVGEGDLASDGDMDLDTALDFDDDGDFDIHDLHDLLRMIREQQEQ